MCLADFEARAALVLAPPAWDYFSSGAGDQLTMRANEDVLTQRVALRPRMLVDVSRASCAHALLGRPCGQPWGIAPTAFHALAHAQAERATARAAARAGVAYCQSGSSSASMEEVTEALRAAPAAPGPLRRLWQLYLLTSREANLRLLARAEAAGVEALVLTVDRPVLGLRRANLRSAFSLPGRKGTDPNACAYNDTSISEALSWEDVAWLRSATRLPLVLKGILTREDGAAAVRAGVAGVWVSNHGGRQLDGALSSAEALVDVLKGVREEEEAARSALPAAPPLPRTAVWVDGGVRRGSDVVKYLALGADFVWLGKPVGWGLAVGGEEGLLALLRVLSEEVRNALQLCGLQSVAQITPACVAWR